MTDQGDAEGDAYHRRRPGRVVGATLALAVVLAISACGSGTSPSGSGAGAESSGSAGDPIAPASASPTPGVIIGAEGGGGGDPNMAAFSDSRSFYDSAWTVMAMSARMQYCSVTTADVEAMGRDAALDRARAHLADAVGEDAMRAFEQSPEASSVEKAKTAAAAAAMSGNDAGALAAMLAAIKHEPDNPRHLVNAAALMPSFGLGSEAIALLDAADGMDSPDSTPYGLDQAAVATANRGRALISLGRWDEAASVLEEAYAIDGTLSEAAESLSLVLLCQGRDDDAKRIARSSRYREKPRMTEGDGSITPHAEDVYDMGLAVEEEPLLPTLQIPSTPSEGVALHEGIRDFKQELVNRSIERSQRQMELQVQLNTAGLHQMTSMRNSDIMSAIAASSVGGKAAGPWAAVTEASRDAFDAWDEYWGPAGEVEAMSNSCTNSDDYNGCMRTECIPATEAFHAGWNDRVGALDRAIRAWATVYHAEASAIAGHIANPTQHELAVLAIQGQLEHAFVDLVAQVEMVAGSEDSSRTNCVGGSSSLTADLQPTTPGAGEPCRMNTGAWTLKIAFVSLQMECSDWSIEAATPGALGAFISVSSKSGATTIFAGPSAGAEAGPFSAGSKSGFYVRSGPTGTTDFGYRVEPGSTAIGSGPVSMSGPALEAMDFSFVGIGAFLPGM